MSESLRPQESERTCQHPGCQARGNYVGENGLCVGHDADRHRRAVLAAGAARAKLLPADAERPSLRTLSAVLDYAETNALLVATGKLDTKVSSEMRGWAACAMAAIELAHLERVARLEKVVRGRRLS